ncbi:MAG: hypothetical protein ACM3TU_01390 [Bacillota bacterium]
MRESKTAEEGVITLCGAQGCCPTVDFTEQGKVVLRDDHGGMVQLTQTEWDELKARFA